MTKADFVDWKSHPVTKLVFANLEQNILGLQAELGIAAGIDPRQDAIKVGAIQAFKDVMDIDWFEETQDD